MPIHPIVFKAKLSTAASALLNKHPRLSNVPLKDYREAAKTADLPDFDTPQHPIPVAILMAALEIGDNRAGRRPSIELIRANERIYGAAQRVISQAA